MHVCTESQLGIQAKRAGELAHRQEDFLDFNTWLGRFYRVGRVLYAVHTRVEQTLAPGLDVPPGLDVQHGVVVKAPAAEHIGIQQFAATAAVVAGVTGELIVAAAFVHGGGRIVIVLAVVDVIVEGTAAYHGAVVVLAQDHFAQRAHAVGGEAATIEVAVGIVGVDRQQAIALTASAHTDAVAGGHRPIHGRAVVELERITGPHRCGHQRNGCRQAADL
ncbi:hypothetical protein D3C87_1262860 [compost metagenome]